MEGQTTCVIFMWDKEPVSSIYKEFLKLNNKAQEEGQKWNFSPKRVKGKNKISSIISSREIQSSIARRLNIYL